MKYGKTLEKKQREKSYGVDKKTKTEKAPAVKAAMKRVEKIEKKRGL